MASILVRRDQFNITPQGIVHKPTDAALPHTLATHILGSRAWVNHPNGNGFRPEDVQRIMWELWTEYVIGNPQLFNTAALRRANWPNANTNYRS